MSNGYEELEGYYQPPDEEQHDKAVTVWVVTGHRGNHEIHQIYDDYYRALELYDDMVKKQYKDVEMYEWDVS